MKGVPERAALLSEVQRVTLTINEAAQYLGIGRDLMYQLARQGAVRCVKFGRAYRLRAVDLDAYLEAQANPVAVPAPAVVEMPVPEKGKRARAARDGRTPMPGSKITPIPWR
jgi:excisionase family DNA binding protein